MLHEILELTRETLTEKQFSEFMDFVTTDVRVNRIAWGKRTSLHDVVDISMRCFVAMGRGNVA